MTIPLGLTSSASSEPSIILSWMVDTVFIVSGTMPERVTPSSRPAKVSTAEPTSTGATRSPGIASMSASFSR